MDFLKKASRLSKDELKTIASYCAGAAFLLAAAIFLSTTAPAKLTRAVGAVTPGSSVATPFGVTQGVPEYNAPTPYVGGYPSPLNCGYGSTDCYPYTKVATLSINPTGFVQGLTKTVDLNNASTTVGSTPTLFSAPGSLDIQWSCLPSQYASKTCSYQYQCGTDWWWCGWGECSGPAYCTAYYDCSVNSTFANTSIGTNFNTGGALIGTTTVTFPGGNSSLTYTLQCKNTNTNQIWTAYTKVFVTSATMSLTAFPTQVVPGGTSLLTWSTSGTSANSCSISDTKGNVGAKGLGTDSSGNANAWVLNNISGADQVFDTPTKNFASLGQNNYYSPCCGGTTAIYAGGLAQYGNYGSSVGWQLNSGKWYWEYTTQNSVNGNWPSLGVWGDITSNTSRGYPGDSYEPGLGYRANGELRSSNAIVPNQVSAFGNADVIGVAYDANTGKTYFSKNGVWQNNDSLIPIMTSGTTNGVTMTDSQEYNTNYSAWKAARGDYSDGYGWDAYPTVPSVGAPQWMRVDFGAGVTKTVGSYAIKNWSSNGNYDPLDFTLEGSNDATTCSAGLGVAGTVWTVLDTETNAIWSMAYQSNVYAVPAGNQAPYRCYRLKVTRSNGNSQLLISEFALYSEQAGTFTDGSGYAGKVQGGWPGLGSYYGKTYINLGQGGSPSVVFKDSSSYARMITKIPYTQSAPYNSYPQISATQSKFGGTSAAFLNGGAATLSTPARPELNVTGDFTIDLWANASLSGSNGLFSRDSNNGYEPYMIYQSGNSFIYYGSSTGGSWDIAGGVAICSGISYGTWYHLAVVRSGNTYSLYCNGTRTNTFTSALTPVPSIFPLVLGRQYSGGAWFYGYLDEVRFSNTARWTGASFTVPTGEYSSDSNTLLLLHMSGNNSDFYDSASGGYFAYTPPAGYKAVSTANLPAPVTTQPANYFNTFLYTGNNSSNTIQTGFVPDLVWIKNRVSTNWHLIADSLRGANSDLFTNSTNGASQNDTNGWVNSFGLNSFTVGGQCAATPPQTDLGGNNYISWAWKRSPVAGIDVVTYTGDGGSLRSIPHALSTTPDTIIVKRLDQPGDWYVWTSALTTPGSYLKLNTTDAETSTNSPFSTDLMPTMTAATTNGITMSSSNEYASAPAWKAADNDTSTYWQSNNVYATDSNPQWLKIDFGAGNAQTVGAYSMRSYSNQGYAPVTFLFQGSNDNSAWTTLDTREYTPWTYGGGDTLTFTVPAANRGSYRYYRFYITKTTQYDTLISELSLWDNGTFPDASQFNIKGDATTNLNVSGAQYVAYVFSNREGFQKAGTYIGNANGDGTFVYTGFKPKFLMIKNTSVGSDNWIMLDSSRSPTNPRDLKVSANSSAAENDSTATQGANTNSVDFLANGFKLKTGNELTNTWSNCQGGAVNISASCYKYAYIAFADVPFKGISTANGYTINNSLHFDASKNTYLSRTFGTPTATTKGTLSFWVKRGGNWGSWQWMYGVNSAPGAIIFDQTDHIRIYDTAFDIYTNQVFRDPSAWVHLVFSFDSTAAAGSRVRAWADNVPLTFQTYAEPALNASFAIFAAGLHNLGVYDRSNNYYFDGNIAEFNYIDGLALTPSSFGSYDGSNYWKPKAYTDVYNKNGFYLNFADRTSLGADASGKGNTWWPQQNGTATYEQSLDSPTNNFTTLNLYNMSSPTYPRGTVQAAGLATNGGYGTAATWKLTSGKWYWENIIGGTNSGYPVLGVWKDPSSGTYWRAYPGHNNDAGFGYGSNGIVWQDAFSTQTPVSGFMNGDVIGVAYDADSGKVYFSRNGVWQSDNNAIDLVPRMNAQTTSGVTMTASTYYTTGYEPWRAGEQVNDASNYWYSYSHVPSVSVPDWLRVDFGAGNPKTVSTYSIKGYSGGLGYEPLNFTFEGSNDTTSCASGNGTPGTVWTVLNTQTNVFWVTPGQVQYFPIAAGSQGSYRCYRVKVTLAGTILSPNGYVIIDQLGLFNSALITSPGSTGYNGIVQGGTPGLTSYYGKSSINFGQGSAPGTTFNDSSGYARLMVENPGGAAVATSSVSKFGAQSLYTGGGTLTTPTTANLNMTGDYTIDLWARAKSSGSAGLISRDTANSYSPYLIYQSGSTFQFYASGSNSDWNIANGQTICSGVVLNTWYHLAVVRSGVNYYLYCNGVRTTSFHRP